MNIAGHFLNISYIISGGRGSRGGQTPAAAAKASTRGRGRGRASPAKKPLAMGVPVANPGSAIKKQPARATGKARGGGNNSIQNAFARQSQAMSSTQNTVLEFDRISCRAQPDWAYEFPDRTGPDTQICQTGPAG